MFLHQSACHPLHDARCCPSGMQSGAGRSAFSMRGKKQPPGRPYQTIVPPRRKQRPAEGPEHETWPWKVRPRPARPFLLAEGHRLRASLPRSPPPRFSTREAHCRATSRAHAGQSMFRRPLRVQMQARSQLSIELMFPLPLVLRGKIMSVHSTASLY